LILILIPIALRHVFHRKEKKKKKISTRGIPIFSAVIPQAIPEPIQISLLVRFILPELGRNRRGGEPRQILQRKNEEEVKKVESGEEEQGRAGGGREKG